jgi:hypothetical protein
MKGVKNVPKVEEIVGDHAPLAEMVLQEAVGGKDARHDRIAAVPALKDAVADPVMEAIAAARSEASLSNGGNLQRPCRKSTSPWSPKKRA